MRSSETTNWDVLLGSQKAVRTMTKFATRQIAATDVRKAFSFTCRAGEFRKLVQGHGTTYARRLTRKALRYRGMLESVSS